MCPLIPEIDGVPGPSDAEARWMEDYARVCEREIREIKAAGLLCLAWTDFVVLPRRVFVAIVAMLYFCVGLGG